MAGLLGRWSPTGYDLEVDMWIPLDGLFQAGAGRLYGKRDNVLIRVKRPNEVSDFTEWSALFAPTGYRHLGFCAKLVAGDKIGLVCSSGLGMTLGGTGLGAGVRPGDSHPEDPSGSARTWHVRRRRFPGGTPQRASCGAGADSRGGEVMPLMGWAGAIALVLIVVWAIYQATRY